MSMQTAPSGIPEWTLGWRLQRALAQAGLTSEQIADELGYSRSSVSRWMNDKGSPRTVVLREWALRCGVPYQWLATGDVDLTEPEGGPGLGVSPSGCIADVLTFRPRESRTSLLTAAAA